jgi:hypothetical protein
MRFLPLLVLAVGCGKGDVTVQGTVFAGQAIEEGALPGAAVALRDQDGVLYDEAVADDVGFFQVKAPRGQSIFAEISAEGFATTSFTGQSGLDTDQPLLIDETGDEISGHTLYAVPVEALEAWRTQLAGCPTLEEGGRALIGEVRVYGIENDETGEEPLVTTASVKAVSTTGVEREGCYLDDEGLAYDPESAVTGLMGFYAVFGLEPGLHTAEITYTAFDTEQIVTYQGLYVPEAEDALVPRFPTWVEFPF